MISVMVNPDIINITNNIFECESIGGMLYPLNTNYTLKDKIFLLSHTEVNLSANPTLGIVTDYYNTHNTNADRIKYRKDNNNAGYWWLRTPHPSYAYVVRLVVTGGVLNGDIASNSYGCAPAWVIQ